MRWIDRRYRRGWKRSVSSNDTLTKEVVVKPKVVPQVTAPVFDKQEDFVGSYIKTRVPLFYSYVVAQCDIANRAHFGGQTLLSPTLVLAIILAESSGNPWACRYEPSFFSWLVKRIKDQTIRYSKGITRQTEETSRATSFGLMQVMGQTAREIGFKGDFLTQLCDPEINVTYGVKYLVSRMKLYHKKEEYIAAYNSGKPKYSKVTGRLINESYVVKVHEYQRKIRLGLSEV